MNNFLQKMLSCFDSKLIKFIIVGVINTLVGTAIMFGLYNLAGFSYWLSSATNYVLTSVLSFFLNKYFTFQNREKSFLQVLKFALNILVCYLLAYGIAKPLIAFLLQNINATLKDNISLAFGMVLFTGFNYLGQRLFAFKEQKPDLDNEKL